MARSRLIYPPLALIVRRSSPLALESEGLDQGLVLNAGRPTAALPYRVRSYVLRPSPQGGDQLRQRRNQLRDAVDGEQDDGGRHGFLPVCAPRGIARGQG